MYVSVLRLRSYRQVSFKHLGSLGAKYERTSAQKVKCFEIFNALVYGLRVDKTMVHRTLFLMLTVLFESSEVPREGQNHADS